MIQTVFTICNSTIVIAWLILMFAPKWKLTMPILRTFWIGTLCSIYSVIVISGISNFKPDSFSTLENIRAIFQEDVALTAGWIHYLAFDLFVGTYIVQDAITKNISRWKYTICLPFTFMFGPVGYLMYLIIQQVSTKKE